MGPPTPLCENCLSSSSFRQPQCAQVFCMNDGCFLCNQCDSEVHNTKIAQRHMRVSYMDAPTWAYQEALAAGRVTASGGDCPSNPNTSPSSGPDMVGESSWTQPAQQPGIFSMDPVLLASKGCSDSPSCGLNVGTATKHPALLNHYTMAISTPDRISEDALANHSNSNSYTANQGGLGASLLLADAQEETQHNASRMKFMINGMDPSYTHHQQHQQQQQQQDQHRQQDPNLLPLSMFSMQTIQEQQVARLPEPSAIADYQLHLQHQQQLYVMRHPHSNQSSAHGGTAFYGVPPPYPLHHSDSHNPSLHGAQSVDTSTVANSAGSHQSLTAMLERFGMPGSCDTSHHNGNLHAGGGQHEGSVHSTSNNANHMHMLLSMQRSHSSHLLPSMHQSSMKSSQTDLHNSSNLQPPPSPSNFQPGRIPNSGVEEGLAPPSLHKTLLPPGLPSASSPFNCLSAAAAAAMAGGSGAKGSKLRSPSPALGPEQSIEDYIMSDPGFAGTLMASAMDQDDLHMGAGPAATQGPMPAVAMGAEKSRGHHAANSQALQGSNSVPAVNSALTIDSNSWAKSSSADGGDPAMHSQPFAASIPPSETSHHHHQKQHQHHLPFQQFQLMQQQQQQQQQGQPQRGQRQQPKQSSPPTAPASSNSTLPFELLASLLSNEAKHIQQQTQQNPELEQLPQGFNYRPTAFQLSSLNIEATPQSVIEERARALIKSSSRNRSGSQPPHQQPRRGGAHKAQRLKDDDDSDDSAVVKQKRANKAKQALEKRARTGSNASVEQQRLRVCGRFVKQDASQGKPALTRLGSGCELRNLGGSMSRIVEEVDQVGLVQGGTSKSMQSLGSPKAGASPRPSALQKSSSSTSHGSGSSTAKGGNSQSSKGVGSAHGGVSKSQSKAQNNAAQLRRALACVDVLLDPEMLAQLATAMASNPSAAPSSSLPGGLSPELQQKVHSSLHSPAVQQLPHLQLRQRQQQLHRAGTVPVPVHMQPQAMCSQLPFAQGVGLASSWSHPSLSMVAQEESMHGARGYSVHGGHQYQGASAHGGTMFWDLGLQHGKGTDHSVPGGRGLLQRLGQGEHSMHGGDSSAHGDDTLNERSRHGGSFFREGGNVHNGVGEALGSAGPDDGICLANELLASLEHEQGLIGEEGSNLQGGSMHRNSIFDSLGLVRLDDNKLPHDVPSFLPPSGVGHAHTGMPSCTSAMDRGMEEQVALITDAELEAFYGIEDQQCEHVPPRPLVNPVSTAPGLKLGSSSPQPQQHAQGFHHPGLGQPAASGQASLWHNSDGECSTFNHDALSDQQVCNMLDALLDEQPDL